MGDRLRAGKPSQYVTSHLGQLSLPSLRGRLIEYQPFWLGLGGARSPCRVAKGLHPHDKWRLTALRCQVCTRLTLTLTIFISYHIIIYSLLK